MNRVPAPSDVRQSEAALLEGGEPPAVTLTTSPSRLAESAGDGAPSASPPEEASPPTPTEVQSIASADSPQPPTGEEPSVEGPVAEGPTREGPTAEGPTVEGPTAEGPIGEGPTVEGSTAEGPTVEGSTGEGPTGEGLKAEEGLPAEGPAAGTEPAPAQNGDLAPKPDRTMSPQKRPHSATASTQVEHAHFGKLKRDTSMQDGRN